MATVLLTGASGLLGRRICELALAHTEHLTLLADAAAPPFTDDRVELLSADPALPGFGLSDARRDALRGNVEEVFCLAIDGEAPERWVASTRATLALATELGAARIHHLSSVAVAGAHAGSFTEHDFDLGQRLRSERERACFECERLVRIQEALPWRIYRPSIVLGDSRSGEIDRLEGPYMLFAAIERSRGWLGEWAPLLAPELGATNVVPLDYVAAAIDHISRAPQLDYRTFQLTDPRPRSLIDLYNAFARAARAPRVALRLDRRVLEALPLGPLALALRLPAVRELRNELLSDFGLAPDALAQLTFEASFERRESDRALAGSGIEVPALEDYAPVLWARWEHSLRAELAAEPALPAQLAGRTMLITGASSGIGRATALELAGVGATVLLVARRAAELELLRTEIEAAGGRAHAFPADLADAEQVDQLLSRVLAAHEVDVLINCAGRSIRRSAALATDRVHDYERMMAINYLAPVRLILGLLEQMRARGGGHVVNVSSIGVQLAAPRFSAYVASKAALDAFTRVVASELRDARITFTTIHMPLVRTPMIEPTQLYEAAPAIDTGEAAAMIMTAIRTRPMELGTPLGHVAALAHELAPGFTGRVLATVYRVLGESGAAPSAEQLALARLLRGAQR